MRARPWPLAIPLASVALMAVLIPAPGRAQQPEAEVVMTVDGDPVYRLLPPDRIPAIRDPRFVSGFDADAQMDDDEPVLGVVIDGEAHAYSLWHLDAHEIVNDVVAEVPVAATW